MPKAKRRLHDINFEATGAHLALVSKDQGGPANGYDTALVMKSMKNFSPEFVEKVQQVKVTMELPDYLQKFFYLWEEDAKKLAYLMGYREDIQQEMEDERQEILDEEAYLASCLSSIELMKSLYAAESLSDALSNLSEEEYLSVLEDQVLVEKALKKAEKTEKAKGKGGKPMPGPKPKCKLVNPEVPVNKSENVMTKVAETIEVEVEVVEKSKFDAATVELTKALDTLKAVQTELEVFKANQKAMIRKARVASVQEVISDEKAVEVLFKALDLVESDEVFIEILDVLKAQADKVEQSAIFTEKGVSTEAAPTTGGDSDVAKLLKARYKTSK